MAGTSDPVHLTAGVMSVDLVPAVGGSVAAFRHGDTDVMRPLSAEDAAVGNVLGVAMFSMVPYANRIAGNGFTFRGRTYAFQPNNPPEKFNVHGTGWHRAWKVDSAATTGAVLSLTVADGAYRYGATQHFVLDPVGLTVVMTVTNDGPDPMPFGFGLHPWFMRDLDATLQFNAKTFYLEEPDGVAGDRITLPPELDFVAERPLPDRWRNNDYGGWDGEVTVRFPSRGLALRIIADPVFRHLMIYADPTKPYFCVEPQTNASGAFNRNDGFDDLDEGILVLGPGEVASGKVRFEAVPMS